MAHELKLKKIQVAAKILRLSSVNERNLVLLTAADLLITHQNKILNANIKDLNNLNSTAASAFRDRLTITPERIVQMAISLKQVAELSDPLNYESKALKLKNGLNLKKIRSPLGVIFMIFESRPNVAVEAFSMGLKSGNAMILRGGKESQHTTSELYRLLKKAINSVKLPTDILWGITNPDRKIVSELLNQKKYIDVVVPRGGENLINYVVKNSTIPIIKNDRGLCHIYVHEDADQKMAAAILYNAKTQRPGVCNSMETMLIHKSIAHKLLPAIYEKMQPHQVRWYVCPKTFKILKNKKNILKAKEKNWNTEYLEQIVNCKIVNNFIDAVTHIEKYGSRHSEAIITANESTAKKFQNEVDAAVVYWNASTRFTDGYEFGLGGELGISTQKLHIRGPVGLMALTSERWIVDGTGQVR